MIGAACFACEKDNAHGDPEREKSLFSCRYCPAIDTQLLSGPDLLKHMGAHILHDPRLRDALNPCGLCLSSTAGCSIFLSKTYHMLAIVPFNMSWTRP